MGISRYRYLHYDVFTDRRFGGNQLAVFPDAAGLRARTMQRIAREIGFAETTFVTAAERPGTDVRMRIFTPGRELPMAGHPVVGSTFALARTGGIAERRTEWVFGLNIGPIPVSLEWSGPRLDFAWMTQGTPEFGRTMDDLGKVAAALGLGEDDIRATGCPFSRSRAVCRSCSCRSPRETRSMGRPGHASARLRGLPVYDRSGRRGGFGDDVFQDVCAGFGIAEDPATGGASGPLGSYLVRHSLVQAEDARSILNLQGVKLGRPSWIHISIESTGGAISRVRVGGTSVFVAEGMMDVED